MGRAVMGERDAYNSNAARERLWILAHLPDLITTFLPADLAHLQQNTLVSKECHCGHWET